MSNRELEERMDSEAEADIASALGITVDELALLNWSLTDDDGNDGAVYGHIVTFGPDSDPEVLEKIPGLVNGSWVKIALTEM